MTIEFREMKWAITVSQHRSLRRAAEFLQVRQSTPSRRMQDLEHRLAAKLFERTNGERARPLPDSSSSSVPAVCSKTLNHPSKSEGSKQGRNGRLAIGVYASLATGNLHAILAEYHRRFPDMDLQTVDGSHSRLMRALESSTLDVAMMTNLQRFLGHESISTTRLDAETTAAMLQRRFVTRIR